MKFIGYVISFIFVIILSVVFNGYALSVLWEWFIVSAFNAPALSTAQAVGVSLVVTFLTHQNKEDGENNTAPDVLIKGILLAIIRPSFAIATDSTDSVY